MFPYSPSDKWSKLRKWGMRLFLMLNSAKVTFCTMWGLFRKLRTAPVMPVASWVGSWSCRWPLKQISTKTPQKKEQRQTRSDVLSRLLSISLWEAVDFLVRRISWCVVFLIFEWLLTIAERFLIPTTALEMSLFYQAVTWHCSMPSLMPPRAELRCSLTSRPVLTLQALPLKLRLSTFMRF